MLNPFGNVFYSRKIFRISQTLYLQRKILSVWREDTRNKVGMSSILLIKTAYTLHRVICDK